MRNLLKNSLKLFTLSLCLIFYKTMMAQEQFSGLLNSPRVSLLQGLNNPAELVNLDRKNEITTGNFSIQVSNNKISSKDLFSNTDLESKLFSSDGDINMNVSTQFTSIGYGLKWRRFGVSLSANTYGQFVLENVNPLLGDALMNNGGNFINMMPMTIQSDKLQKMDMILYTDVALGFGTKLLNTENHKVNLGVNAKILFPKAFVNVGINNLNASLTEVNQGINAFTATGDINIAYSSDALIDVSTLNPFSNISLANLKGVSLGFGFNYQFYRDKDLDSSKNNNYLINLGVSYQQSGKTKFESNKTRAHNYNLNITPNALNPDGLNLNQIGSIANPDDIFNLLETNDFITTGNTTNSVEVELPSRLNLYADIKLLKVLYTSVYWQKNLNESENNIISSPDFLTITPRLVVGKFEFFTPITKNSTAQTSIGSGIKWGLFYLSSGSGLSMAFGNSKRADFCIGFSKGF